MRKLIVTEFASIDGVMDSPGGEAGYKHSGWTFAHADGCASPSAYGILRGRGLRPPASRAPRTPAPGRRCSGRPRRGRECGRDPAA
jgi:hypothetical protein